MTDRPQLVTSRASAQELVEEQLRQGDELLKRDLPSKQSLSEAENDRTICLDVTREVLRQIATTDLLAEDFNSSLFGFVGTYLQQPLRAEVDDFRSILSRSVVKLSAIYKRLDLIPESVGADLQKPDPPLPARKKVEINSDFEWDVFISHASEDKEPFVRELASTLQDQGLRVWYDEITITIGDSLRQTIDRGLSKSRYGIVVLSHAFFAKKWTQQELDGLDAKERDGTKVILPVWLGVTEKDVAGYSPILAGRFAAIADQGIDNVVAQILKAMNFEKTAGQG